MGDEQRAFHGRTDHAGTRAVRVRDGLHGRRRGGVRDPRCRVARPDESLRGRPGGGPRDRTRGAPRGRAHRLRGRDPHRQAGDVRRRPWRAGRAAGAAPVAGRADGAPARRDRNASLGGLEEAAHHRHAALPPKRRAACATSSGATTPSGSMSTSPINGRRSRDRGRRRHAELPPRAPRALRELAVRGGRLERAPLGAHADLHALLSALRRAGCILVLGRVRELRALPLRHGLDHRAHADLVERSSRTSRSRPSRSGSATASPSSRRRSPSLRSPRRSPPASRARTTRASPSSRSHTGSSRRTSGGQFAGVWPASSSTSHAAKPSRRGSDSRSSSTGSSRSADEIGATPYLAVPEQNAAERQIERYEDGSSLEEIYAEQVRATETIGG